MSRRDRLAELYGFGDAKAAQSAAASLALAVPGAGIPVAAAIELAPLAINELIHPVRTYEDLKHEIFGIFGHRSHDQSANTKATNVYVSQVEGWTKQLKALAPAVEAAGSRAIAQKWNAVAKAVKAYPLIRTNIQRFGMPSLPCAVRSRHWCDPERNHQGSIITHGLQAIRSALRGARVVHKPTVVAHAPSATHVATVAHTAPVTRTADAAEIAARAARTAALRKQAIAAIAAAKALSARVAAGDAAAKPAYATAYRRAQDLIIQTRTAQSVPLATAPAKRKKSTAAWIGWLAAGAGVLDLARRAL